MIFVLFSTFNLKLQKWFLGVWETKSCFYCQSVLLVLHLLRFYLGFLLVLSGQRVELSVPMLLYSLSSSVSSVYPMLIFSGTIPIIWHLGENVPDNTHFPTDGKSYRLILLALSYCHIYCVLKCNLVAACNYYYCYYYYFGFYNCDVYYHRQ